MGICKGKMKYVEAGLAAIVMFFVAGFLLIFIEDPVRDLIGGLALDVSLDMMWWRTGAGLVPAASVFWLIVRWRNNAALKWRKTLAARARA
jgi:hypothetical protein